MSSEGIEFRVFQDGDEAIVNNCFNQVFGTDRSLDEWAFRFRAIGSARKIVVAIQNGGDVAATVAGVATRIMVGGTTLDALVVVEAFTSNRPAGEGERRSLLDRTLSAFADQYGRSGSFSLIFISPGDAAFVAPPLDSPADSPGLPFATALRRETRSRRAPRSLFYRAEAGRDWEPRLDDLWERVRRSYTTSIVRDADFALRRYAGNPVAKYHRFLVLPRFSSDAVAYAVFKLEGNCCTWVDLLWDHEHPGALELVAHISSRLAAQTGIDGERVVLGGDDGSLVRLQAQGFEPELCRGDLSLQILFRDSKSVPGSFPDGHYLTAVDLEKI